MNTTAGAVMNEAGASNRSPRLHSQRGYTLVELMVSMTLGLILVAGVVTMFVSSKQGYRVQESAGRMQENARFAMTYLAEALRQADFWGGVPATSVLDSYGLSNASGTPCADDALWIADYRTGLQGWTGGTASPLGDCTVADYVANSDVIIARFADPNEFILDAGLAAAAADPANGPLFIRTAVGRNAVLFDGANYINAQALIPGTESTGVLTYRYGAYVFFIRNFVSGEKSVPSLYWRRMDSSGVSDSQQLVEGVEQMKFSYGMDNDGDRIVDSYVGADAVTAWNNVLAVRVALIVRGDELDRFTDTQSYPMTPTFDYTPATDAQRFQRRMYVRDIQVRNRVRG